MSIRGMKNVYWLIIVSEEVTGSPSTMIPTSNDVPPMSQAITFLWPRRSAR